MTAKTRSQLKSENAADFPDNTARLISPSDLRGQMDDVVDSALFPEDVANGLNVSAANVTSSPSSVTKTLALWTGDLDAKAPLASPALSGIPTAPTANVGTSSAQIATTAFVAASVGVLSDPELSALASTTSAANALPYYTGVGTALTTPLSNFGRSLIDDVDANTALTTLGVASDAQSISVFPQKHIMRRSIGSSDCPMVEASTAGQSVANAAKLKTAFETYGHLDAGPFGASYDLANVKPNMLTTPIVRLEGNGSQTFNALPADFTNDQEGGQYNPTAALFQFEGLMTGQGTAGVAVTYGGEAHLCGVRIIGPGTGSGTQRCSNPVLGRFLNRLFVEDCDISNFQRGNLICVVAVRYGGRLNGNFLHDCSYDAALGPSTMEMWGIGIDDNKPGTESPVVPDRFIGWSDGFEIASNVIDHLININGVMQTDGINLQMLTRNHRIHDNRIKNVGDGIDGGAWHSTIDANIISDCVFGLKMGYGMNNTIVASNILNDIAQYGITLAGSGFTTMPTQDSLIIGNRVARVNMALAAVTAAGLDVIYVAANPPTTNGTIAGYLRRTVVRDNVLDPQGNAKTIAIEGETEDLVLHNNHEVVRGAAQGLANNAFAFGRMQTRYSYKKPSDPSPYFASAYLTADSAAIPSPGTVTDITGWTVIADRSSEFNATTGVYTCADAGNRRIRFQVTIKGVIAAITLINVFVRVTRAGGGGRDWTFKGGDPPLADGTLTFSGSVDEIIVGAGDTIRLAVGVTGGDATTKVSGIAGSFYFTSFGVSGV